MFSRNKKEFEPLDVSPKDLVFLELAAAFRKERRAARRSRWLMFIFLFGFLFVGIAVQLANKAGVSLPDASNGEGKITSGVIHITGAIAEQTSKDTRELIDTIERAFKSKKTDRIILLINSPGGSPYIAARINKAIELLREKYDKPVISIIESMGASAAYLIAIHTDKIYADKYSMVGSIGAKMTAWNVSKPLEEWNVSHLVFASGKLKNMLDPFTPPSDDANQKAFSLVQDAANQFIAEVAEKRSGKLTRDIQELATGEVWMGTEALNLGLIDELGNLETVLENTDSKAIYFEKKRSLGEQLLSGAANAVGVELSGILQGQWQWQ